VNSVIRFSSILLETKIGFVVQFAVNNGLLKIVSVLLGTGIGGRARIRSLAGTGCWYLPGTSTGVSIVVGE
jgi:hypothetical protein